MVSLIVIAFLISGLQAIHGLTPFSSLTDSLAILFLALEHGLNGNTVSADASSISQSVDTVTPIV